MGMSAFKLFLILAAVGVLFLPTLIRRSSALPAAFEQLRSRISGEDPVQDSEPRRESRRPIWLSHAALATSSV
jgi:hypothetical protein